MKTITSDNPIPAWIETKGKIFYTFDHTEEEMEDEMIEEKRKVYHANYVELDSKDEAVAKKLIKQEILDSLTVTISTGKTFLADPQSRQDLNDAISSAEFLGQTETIWKLAKNMEPRWQKVTLDEAREALALAIQKKGETIAALS